MEGRCVSYASVWSVTGLQATYTFRLARRAFKPTSGRNEIAPGARYSALGVLQSFDTALSTIISKLGRSLRRSPSDSSRRGGCAGREGRGYTKTALPRRRLCHRNFRFPGNEAHSAEVTALLIEPNSFGITVPGKHRFSRAVPPLSVCFSIFAHSAFRPSPVHDSRKLPLSLLPFLFFFYASRMPSICIPVPICKTRGLNRVTRLDELLISLDKLTAKGTLGDAVIRSIKDTWIWYSSVRSRDSTFWQATGNIQCSRYLCFFF